MIVYLTPNAVAQRLGVKTHTLAKWRVSGDGPLFVRVSPRMIRYVESDVDEWMASRVRLSTSDTGARSRRRAA